MKKKEKEKIVKRHFAIFEKCGKLEEEMFWAKMKQRGKALKLWKDKMKLCL